MMAAVRHVICRPCGGLRGFITEHDADKALGRAQSKRARVRGAHIESRYYEGDCGYYHLTAQSKRTFQSYDFAFAG